MGSLDEHNYLISSQIEVLADEVIPTRPGSVKRRSRSSIHHDYSKEVYSHFTLVQQGRVISESKFKCDYCEYSIMNKKVRMIHHLESKHGYDRKRDTFNPAEIIVPPGKRLIETDLIDSVDLVDEDDERVITPQRRVKVIKNRDRTSMTASSLNTYVHHLDSDQMERAQCLLASFMFEKALPFTTFESSSWYQFIALVAPAFKTPSEYKFRTSLLDSCYAQSMTKSSDALNSSHSVTIGIDECKLSGKPHMINFLALLPEPFFLQSYDSQGSSITTDYLESLFKKTLIKHELKARAIISDNGSNVRGLRRRLESTVGVSLNKNDGSTESIRCLSIYCLCHGVSLMIQDLAKDSWVKKRVDLALLIANKFNQKDEMRQILSRYTSMSNQTVVRFNIPPKVRWLYMQRFLESFIRYKDAIKMMFFAEGERVQRFLTHDRSSIDTGPLIDDSYWKDLEHIQQAILPLCDAIKRAESTSSTISEGFVTMINLKESKEKFIQFMENREMNADSWARKFDDRFNDIVSDNHRLAAFLDPRFRCDSKVMLTYPEAQKFLVSAADLLGFDQQSIDTMKNDLFDFVEMNSPFDAVAFSSFRKEWGTTGWWRRFAQKTKIIDLALILMSIPSSNASVERSFSHQGLIFTKRRQHMTADQLNKLTKLKFDGVKKGSKSQLDLDDFNTLPWEDINLEEIEEEQLSCDLQDDEQASIVS